MERRGKKNKKGQHFLNQINEDVPDNIVIDPSRPDCTFEIDHVYGFSGDRNRACLYFGKDNNEMVYPAAALGIVMDLKTRKQRFFGGGEKDKDQDKYVAGWPSHQDDITSLDVAGGEGRNIVATGECGKMSTVHVWDLNSMTSIANFSLGGTAKGVACVAISPCQRYVAAVDQSNDHTMYIYNVQRKKMLLTLSAGSDAIYNMQWSKKPNDLRFAAVTSRALQFWNPADASKKLFRNGTFGSKFQQTKFACATFDEDGICYSGGANGGIHVWDQKQELGLVLKAHAGAVTALACAQGTLVSAGKDDIVSIFKCEQGEYQFVRQVALGQHSYASCLDVLGGKILIGHDAGRIQTLGFDDKGPTNVAFSHMDGESWGLHLIEQKGTFLTCGDDNRIVEYDIAKKKAVREGKVWSSELFDGKPFETKKIRSTASTLSAHPAHQQARCITYTPVHNHIAYSNNYGDVTIIDYADWSKRITTLTKAREWCEAMSYSPDGAYLAVGSHDDSVYIYKVSDQGEYTLHWAITFVHSSAILGMDWSHDNQFLRVVDQAYQKIFYNIVECQQVTDGANTLTDPMIWQTSTCKLGWDVNGVFPLGADGTDVNTVDASAERALLAVGDDFGTVCVYRFPAVRNDHECVRLTGHSEHVPRVRFYEGNKHATYLISAGGNDRTYIQWKMVERHDE